MLENRLNFLQNSPITNINQLNDDCLRRILSYVSVPEKLLFLESVCKRWLLVMPYDDRYWRHINITKTHSLLCRSKNCVFETGKRYPTLYRQYMLKWLQKALGSLTVRCPGAIRSLNVSGLPINSRIVQLLCRCYNLVELDITKCFLTQSAIDWLVQAKLTTLFMDGDEVDEEDLEKLSVYRLNIGRNFDSTRYANLDKLVHLRLTPNLFTSIAAEHIFKFCKNLTSFEINHTKSIEVACFEHIRNSDVSKHLNSLSMALSYESFSPNSIRIFENLTELRLRITNWKQARHVPLQPLLALTKLHTLYIYIRCISQYEFLSILSRLPNLTHVEANSKFVCECHICSASNFETEIASNKNLKLQTLKLSLECMGYSTLIANRLLPLSPLLTNVHLMKQNFDNIYGTSKETSVKRAKIAKCYNQGISNLKNLTSVTLPYVNGVENDRFCWNRFNDDGLKKIFIYAGLINFNTLRISNDISLNAGARLKTLKLGSNLKSQGLEWLITKLVHLKRLSFHINAVHQSSTLMYAIGRHPTLAKVDIRNCNSYFFVNIKMQLSPLLKGREEKKSETNFVQIKPTFINIWSGLRSASIDGLDYSLLNNLLLRLSLRYSNGR